MENSNVSFLWQDPDRVRQCTAAVSLHGHTLHSEECLSFLPRYLHRVPGVSQIVKDYERNGGVDFARAWWTPPLTPASAFRLEQSQIAQLGLRAIVSLTDHDNIEAPMALQVAVDRKSLPVSLEWTVPYERSILHLGIHNLPPLAARAWMAAMAAYTASPDEKVLPGMLSELSAIPSLLIVLNHPFWLEEGVEEPDHRRALARVLQECVACLHAFELNGTRRWSENLAACELAAAHGKPVISGGDRHACEPSACINLTNAKSFGEFAEEVRAGYSSLLFLPQYREPMPLRILEAAWDILRPYPDSPGRERWTDRVYYRGEDSVARTLSTLWKDRIPNIVRPVTGMIQLAASPSVRSALRLLLSRRAEAQP